MDSIIKEAVREEVRRQMTNQKPEKDNSDSSKREQSRRTQTRMGKLLDKIRKGTKSSNTRPRVDKEHRLQVRWLHYNAPNKQFFPVKQRNSGGHRFISYFDSEPLTLKGIQEKASELFFPNGSNTFAGKLSDMSIRLCDSTEAAIFEFPGGGTVDAYFKAKGLYPSSTFFYFRTQPLTLLGDEFEDDDMFLDDDLNTDQLQGKSSFNASTEPFRKKLKIDENMFDDNEHEDDSVYQKMIDFSEIPTVSSSQSQSASTSTSTATQETSVNRDQLLANRRAICDKCSSTYAIGEECLRCFQDAEYDQSLKADKVKEAVSDQSAVEETPVVDLEQLRRQRLAHLTENIPDIPPPDAPPEDEPQNCEKEIEVHRTTIKNDLIKVFSNQSIIHQEIKFRLIDERGNVEAGLGTGVNREVYCLFWNDFSISMTIGERERVPFVRHDHFVDDYDAIGRILVKGFISVGYFPLFIAKAFICYCLFGVEVTDNIFLNSFKRFLSPSEEELIENMLSNDALPDDEFIEFLDRFNCRSLVKKENVERILVEIAKQEIISKPHMMMAAWQPLLQKFLKPYNQFRSIESVMNMYNEYRATPKRVLQNLSCNPQTNGERDAFKYLQRYIRGLDSNKLGKFLRFSTGMDIMTREKIQVSFLSNTGFSSSPIAHTCAPLLEIPSSYNNFVELREEFENILNQNICWDINIV